MHRVQWASSCHGYRTDGTTKLNTLSWFGSIAGPLDDEPVGNLDFFVHDS